jgi:hypothetical protein
MTSFMKIVGVYHVECRDRKGDLLWSDICPNTVVTVGKDLALDTILAGSTYTVTGPYMGLITATGFSGISSADTMASHPGWLECGGANAPQFSGTRQVALFNAAAAGSKSLSTALSYTMTSSGTVNGCFIVYGTGALAALDSTAGTLFSAGLFASGTKNVGIGDTINVSYTVSM